MHESGGIMLFLQVALLGSSNAYAMEVSDIIKKVEETYKDVQSIEADFTQTTANPALPEPFKQGGHLYMMKPQQIRWDFLTPMVQSYYSDGKSITVWNEINNQVLISSQMGQANELVSLLTDLSKLSDKYTLALQKEEEKAYFIGVTPKEKQQFDSMEISIRKDSWILERIFVKGEMTGEITLDFSNVQLNTISDAAVFTFTPPEGAEIIKTEGF